LINLRWKVFATLLSHATPTPMPVPHSHSHPRPYHTHAPLHPWEQHLHNTQRETFLECPPPQCIQVFLAPFQSFNALRCFTMTVNDNDMIITSA
jgi:hypothetical protein